MGASMSNGPGKDIEIGKGYFVEDTEVNPCDLCARRTTELAALPWKQKDGSKGVDYACDLCRAVLKVAQSLLNNKIKDENEIITTIALASYAGLSWTEVAKQPPEYFEREHPGLRLSRNVDGMPLFRMLPLLVEVVRYDGTELPKEIRLRVFSRSVQPEDLALHSIRAGPGHRAHTMGPMPCGLNSLEYGRCKPHYNDQGGHRATSRLGTIHSNIPPGQNLPLPTGFCS